MSCLVTLRSLVSFLMMEMVFTTDFVFSFFLLILYIQEEPCFLHTFTSMQLGNSALRIHWILPIHFLRVKNLDSHQPQAEMQGVYLYIPHMEPSTYVFGIYTKMRFAGPWDMCFLHEIISYQVVL